MFGAQVVEKVNGYPHAYSEFLRSFLVKFLILKGINGKNNICSKPKRWSW